MESYWSPVLACRSSSGLTSRLREAILAGGLQPAAFNVHWSAPQGVRACDPERGTVVLTFCILGRAKRTSHIHKGRLPMTTLQGLALGFLSAAMMAMGTGPADAQITGNGPYYPPPSWDLTLPGSNRFIILSNFGGAAVLDRETGLVWERSPGDTNGDGLVNLSDAIDWFTAQELCNARNVGGRMGWRLPIFQELGSLVDKSQINPVLPAGHPFVNVQLDGGYWTATTSARDANRAWALAFNDSSAVVGPKTGIAFLWCVRFRQGVDPQ